METNTNDKPNTPASGLHEQACSLLFRGEVGEWKKSSFDLGGDGQNLQPIIAACCAKCWNAIERKEGESGISWHKRLMKWWELHKANDTGHPTR